MEKDITKPRTITYTRVPRKLWRKLKKHLPKPPPARTGTTRVQRSGCAQRHLVCAVEWLPVEIDRKRMVSCLQQCLACPFSNLAKERALRSAVYDPGQILCPRAAHWLEMAICGQQNGSSPSGRGANRQKSDRSGQIGGQNPSFWWMSAALRWPFTSRGPTSTTNGRSMIWSFISWSSALTRNSISVWIKAMTMRIIINLSKSNAISRTSNIVGAEMNPKERNVPSQEKPVFRPAAGWWKEPWDGWQNDEARSKSAGARNPKTGWPSSNWLVPTSCSI